MISSQNLPHWNYFRILEKDLEECFRYIEPSQNHFSVYSDEFAKLILVACSEIENALRALTASIDPNKTCKNLGDYKDIVFSKYPYFSLIKISIARYGLIVILIITLSVSKGRLYYIFIIGGVLLGAAGILLIQETNSFSNVNIVTHMLASIISAHILYGMFLLFISMRNKINKFKSKNRTK